MAKKKTTETANTPTAKELKLLRKKAEVFDAIADHLYPTIAMLRKDFESDCAEGEEKPSDQDLLDWTEWDGDTIEHIADLVLLVYPAANDGKRTL